MLTDRDRQEIAKNARNLISSRRTVGPATACTLLELFLTNKLQLTENEFDELVGYLHHHLEQAYDERWRLIKDVVPRAEGGYLDDEDEKTDPGTDSF